VADIHLVATDGRRLAATWSAPARPRAVVVVAGATGVPRGYYARFARALAAAGCAVLTFDYRGIGASRDRPLRADDARMEEWGRLDLDAALVEARRRQPRLVQVVVAHSVGGQIVALAPASRDLDAVVFVAAQSGYWRHWRWPWALMVWSLWHVLIPVLTRIGRFPARLLGMGADLPAGVARQWAFWGRHPQYVVDDEGRPRSELEAFAPPILALAPVDDARFAPEPALAGLLRRYAGAPHRVVRLPAPLGHFGFFRPGMEDWWKSLAQWTARRGPEPAPEPCTSTCIAGPL
jgi:predicted alpha/beta hydrolase